MQGRVENVWVHTLGTWTTAAASSGATVLSVNGIGDLGIAGGVVEIEGASYAYTVESSTTDVNGIRTDLLEITPGLVGAVIENTPVVVLPEAQEKIALVRLTDGSATDGLYVNVPHALVGYFPLDGNRDPALAELVNFELVGSDYVITDVLGKKPELDPFVVEGLEDLYTITLPALQANLTELETVTLPAMQADLDELNSLDLPALATSITDLNTALDAAEADVAALEGRFPITAPDIAADAITANEIAADAITANELAADSVTSDKILANTITANDIAANTITANEIAANTITANEIAADAVTAVELAADSVIAGKIGADAITSREIQTGAITAGEIAAGTLEAGFVLAGSIQVGIDTWTPNEGLVFPGRMQVPAPYGQLITITGAPTGGSFTLTAGGVTTSSIAYNASAATVQTAVRALGGAFTGAIVDGSAGGPWTVDVGDTTPTRKLARTSSLTGGTSPEVVVSSLTNPPNFTGGVTATSLTVQKDFNLLGTSNQIKGLITLANGIVAPTVAPTMWQSWDSVGQHAMPFGATDYGLTNHLTDSNLLLTAVAFFGGAIQSISKSNGQYFIHMAQGNPASSNFKTWCVDFNIAGGITTVGSNYFVLGRDDAASRGANQGSWYVYKLDSNFDKVAERLMFSNTGTHGNPIIGNDGAGNILVGVVAANSITGVVGLYLRSLTAGANFTTDVIGFPPHWSTFDNMAVGDMGYLGLGNFDFGASRYVFSLAAYKNTYVTDASGNRLSDAYVFPSAGGHTPRGMWWDGTRFWSYGSDGTLYKHAASSDLISARTVTASYTWYDGDTSSGSTSHETSPSPSSSFTQAPRTFLNIQTELAPDSGVTDALQRDKANRVGIYAAVGAGTRRLQQYNGVDGSGVTIRTLRLDTVSTGGQTESTPTGFLGATSSPGQIKTFGAVSGTGGVIINGDGSVQLGTFQMNSDGSNVLGKNLADTGWIDITLLNGWVNYDSGTTSGGSGRAAQYRKINGVVYFRGVIRSGSNGGVWCVMPAGFNMAATTNAEGNWICAAAGGYSAIGINASNGQMNNAWGGTNNGAGFTYLVSVSYVADA